ncbi:MAG: hypothetical protein P9L94_16335 [Candidatus Hinthialibacter antarcticus]|nr:hypothetical protein [Candidatus Hinthialibacter antarcticus]
MHTIPIQFISRRTFVQINAGLAAGAVLPAIGAEHALMTLEPAKLLNGLKQDGGEELLENGAWYSSNKTGAGLEYNIPKGSLSEASYLCSDFIVDGDHLAVFQIRLHEANDGPSFSLHYKGLNQAQARIRLPLSAVNLNKWRLEREGAWLKPICGGQRVDLANVDRITLTVMRKSESPVRWMQTPLLALKNEPARLTKPVLPKGKLIDELGQSLIHQWPGRTKNETEMKARLEKQKQESAQNLWPEHFSKWGGWKEKKVDSTGFFRTHHDGKRWHLIDPDGHYFWSSGLDCVRAYINSFSKDIESAFTWLPEEGSRYRSAYNGQFMNYLQCNFMRTFGADAWYQNWAKISLSVMKQVGFNTVGNWSNWDIARDAQFPYVIPLSTRLARSKMVYRDFPDVFHSDFELDAAEYGKQLEAVRDDKALIGYFLMNEPTWGFSSESPAAGMLFNAPSCETRKALAKHLGAKYGDGKTLAQIWGIKTDLEQVAQGEWKHRLTEQAKKDLYEFSEVMVEKLFKALSSACKSVDPNHLNLGIRYASTPPKWTIKGMEQFDVFSMNSYTEKVSADVSKETSTRLNMPVMIGEWHFGALDAGLPASGIGRVHTQADRGRAYRYYLEDAAANPYCVGVHWFTMYDQSAMGRFDGENYNIGFLDACNRPYKEIAEAARTAHERMYSLVMGDVKPFNDPPEYLPKLF